MKKLMKGNEAIAEAAIIAGCRYYFGYPITPQNEIPAYMSRRMPQVGGTFLQAESELAAINMTFGAAAAGARTMTSSSSPGMALKQEGVSYLAGAELPAVIVNIMRGGPGLGNIAGAQGDYFQATRGGGNGDYRTIVLAPCTVQEMADLTVLAFDLADKYMNPVMILGDGYLGQMAEALELPEPTNKTFDKPWALTGTGENGGRKQNIVRSLILSPDDALEKHNLILQQKYEEMTEAERRFVHTEGEDVLMVAYGTGARLCNGAINSLKEEGISCGLFRPVTLWPFPYEELKEAAQSYRKVMVVELSAGQMLDDVKIALEGTKEIEFYGRAGGMLPEEEEIIRRAKI